jgi:RimJ/RimL family protein N-acetyltransferase
VTFDLTPLRPDDSDTLFKWINDRELVLRSAAFRPVSREAHDAWFTAIRLKNDAFIFAIRLSPSGQLVGTCQLHGIDWIARRAQLQIRIGDGSARGRGLGTEAVRRLVEFGFRDLNLHRIDLHVFADNAPARRAYEKAGFAVEACLRDAAFINDRYIDVIRMAVLNG